MKNTIRKLAALMLAALFAALAFAACVNKDGGRLEPELGPSVVTKDGSNFAIKSDNSLWAWGKNEYGQLGDGTKSDRAVPAHILDSVAQVICCGKYTYAIKTDGALYGWGENDGKTAFLGDGASEPRLSPVRIMENVARLRCCGSITYAITSGSELWAWGDNSGGMLGDGTFTNRLAPIAIMKGVTEVESGRLIASDGAMYLFGGQDTSSTGRKPRSVKPYKAYQDVASFVGSEYFLTTDGRLMEPVPAGQTGAGEAGYAAIAEDVASALAVPVGGDYFYIKKDGTLWAFGNNWNGILGEGSMYPREQPVQIMDGAAKIYADSRHVEDYGYQYVFVIKTNGELWSWGEDFCGSLGRPTTDWPELTPKLAAEGVASVVTDGWSTFIIKKDGTLWACGYNGDGLLIGHPGERARLGDGSTENRHEFVKVLDHTALFVHDLSVSYTEDENGEHFTDLSRSFAVTSGGELLAWGYNADGLLGTDTEGTVLEPAAVMKDVRIGK